MAELPNSPAQQWPSGRHDVHKCEIQSPSPAPMPGLSMLNGLPCARLAPAASPRWNCTIMSDCMSTFTSARAFATSRAVALFLRL
eukprot:4517013-Prymnesium_polylepis.1